MQPQGVDSRRVPLRDFSAARDSRGAVRHRHEPVQPRRALARPDERGRQAAAATAPELQRGLQGRAERLAHPARAGRGAGRAGHRSLDHQPEGDGAAHQAGRRGLSRRRSRSSCSTARWRATSSRPSSAPTTRRSDARRASGRERALGGKGNDRRAQGPDDLDARPGSAHGLPRGPRARANPGIKVVFEADMQWLEPNARKEMESALVARARRSISSTRTTIPARTAPTSRPSRPGARKR